MPPNPTKFFFSGIKTIKAPSTFSCSDHFGMFFHHLHKLGSISFHGPTGLALYIFLDKHIHGSELAAKTRRSVQARVPTSAVGRERLN